MGSIADNSSANLGQQESRGVPLGADKRRRRPRGTSFGPPLKRMCVQRAT